MPYPFKTSNGRIYVVDPEEAVANNQAFGWLPYGYDPNVNKPELRNIRRLRNISMGGLGGFEPWSELLGLPGGVK